ncbi:DUF1642 domain-containing protein [Marinilactibacillus psychrotolerans]|uniref:DUF1642 domain-containing protein n=1 Tax=Marinilactibacillus psychrotolerans TaxID=191770 RepID=UPI0039B00467
MNKENGIKRLNRLSVKAKEYRDENTQVVKLSQAIEVIELIDQLDEPKEIVMPKEFDDWYQGFKGKWKEKSAKHAAIVNVNKVGFGYSLEDEWDQRVGTGKVKEYDNLGSFVFLNKELCTRAILNGYEVEKQKKYRIKSGSNYVWFNLDGAFRGSTKNNAILTQERLDKLPFDVKKAVDSGIIILEEVSE